MKILVISDLHYNKRVFRGVDESKAWEWLLSIVDYHKPTLLLSCGDWGEEVTIEEFYELLKKVTVLTIYGNHENMQVLEALYNVRSDKYLEVLMKDGKVYEINGLSITGINGIIASKRTVRKGVPRKVAKDFLDIAKKLKDNSIDILLIHEAPALKEVYPEIRVDYATLAVLESIKIIKPRIVFNGHLHWSCYTVYRFNGMDIVYVRIDSSQAHRCYAVYCPNENKIEIWRDYVKADEVTVCS